MRLSLQRVVLNIAKRSKNALQLLCVYLWVHITHPNMLAGLGLLVPRLSGRLGLGELDIGDRKLICAVAFLLFSGWLWLRLGTTKGFREERLNIHLPSCRR